MIQILLYANVLAFKRRVKDGEVSIHIKRWVCLESIRADEGDFARSKKKPLFVLGGWFISYLNRSSSP